MTAHITAFLLLAALFATLYGFGSARRLRRHIRREDLRFRLFAARDRLYLVAAHGTIPVGSHAFRGLRDVISHLIRESNVVGVPLFLQLTSDTNDGPATFLDELSAEGKIVFREIAVQVGETMAELFRTNSRLIRFLEFLRRSTRRLERREYVKQMDIEPEVMRMRQSGSDAAAPHAA